MSASERGAHACRGKSERKRTGTLYMVATPIGHLGDITLRAMEILRSVSIVAAEDTRRSRGLLAHLDAHPRELLALHDHNESSRSQALLRRLEHGEDVAVVSDAGTPLISDPGFELVRMARAAGIRVVPIPGASAITALLAASPMPMERFFFEGFLPPRSGRRRRRLEALERLGVAVLFFETPRRIDAALSDVIAVCGGERAMVIGRELTKRHEWIGHGSAAELRAALAQGESGRPKGELVCLLAPGPVRGGAGDADPDRILRLLAEELPPAQAARLAARLTGLGRARLYRRLLALTAGARESG